MAPLAALILTALLSTADPAAVQTPASPEPAPQQHSTWISRAFASGDAVVLGYGERLTLSVDRSGAVKILRAEKISPADVKPPSSGSSADNHSVNSAPAGVLIVSLSGSRETGSVMKLENGLGRHFAYGAGIVTVSAAGGLKSSQTSVCSVPAKLASWETWPQPVYSVVLAAFHDVQGETPVCR